MSAAGVVAAYSANRNARGVPNQLIESRVASFVKAACG
jgi:hypothetical protein